MGSNRDKVQTFLASVINNCKLNRPFKMNDITRLVGITSNAGTIIKRLGLIERSHNRGEVGHEWKWKATGLETLPQLTEIVSRALDGYQSTFNTAALKEQQSVAVNLGFPGSYQDCGVRHTHIESRQEESRHVNQMPAGTQPYVQLPNGETIPSDKLTIPLRSINRDLTVSRQPLPDINSEEAHAALAGCMEPGFTGSHLGPNNTPGDDAQGSDAEAATIDLPAAIADIQRKVDAIYHAVMPPVPCGF